MGDGTEVSWFKCQDCPYYTGSVDLAERHERRMEHDVWEVARDAQPKPTAADVLRGHLLTSRVERGVPWSCCTCGVDLPSGSVPPVMGSLPQHQADMLAAAGMLVAAEHDAGGDPSDLPTTPDVRFVYVAAQEAEHGVVSAEWGRRFDRWLAEHDAQVAALYAKAPQFWRQVSVGRATECWPWTGKDLRGYGKFESPAGHVAHRYSWAMANGTLPPEGMVVRHRCDNPPCCNPGHLELGTQQDNVDDMVDRGRAAFDRGWCRNGHELTPDNTLLAKSGGRRCKACTRHAEADRREHAERVTCEHCGKVLRNKYNLPRHLERMHGIARADRITGGEAT